MAVAVLGWDRAVLGWDRVVLGWDRAVFLDFAGAFGNIYQAML
jgi:hypothetical protein